MKVREINVKFVFQVNDEISDNDIINDLENVMFSACQRFDESFLYSDNPDHMITRDATEEEIEIIKDYNEEWEEEWGEED